MVRRITVEDGHITRLKQIMDKEAVAVSMEGQKVRSALYASDYGQCMRKQWMQFFPEEYQPEVPMTPRTARIFQNGNAVHERLSGYLHRVKKLNFREEIDVPRDELEVHGRCDGLMELDDQFMVVDFKSTNRNMIRQAKDEHIGQITWYMMMWKKLRKDLKEDFGFKEHDVISAKDLVGVESLSGRTLQDLSDIDKMLMFTQGEIRSELIYESKPTQNTYHFPVDYDEDRAEKVKLWFQQLDWHVRSKVRPNVHWDKAKFPCKWGSSPSTAGRCPFYDYCWGEK